MLSRGSQSSDKRPGRLIWIAAATVLLIAVAAAAFFIRGSGASLVLKDPDTGKIYAKYPAKYGDNFSVGFVHSVNKSPVTDFYEIRRDGIYVVKTVYYGFGAGVQTEIEEGQKLEYGDDGSMIVTGFDRRIDDLTYIVGTVSDHILTLADGREISLRDLCGRSAKVRFALSR